VPPATLLGRVGEHLAQRLPEPERAVADGEHRRGHPAAFAAAQQVSPRLRALPEPVGERDQLLRAVGADTDHHQQAHLVLLEADLEMDPVDLRVHVVGAGQRTRAERDRLVLPLRGEPGDRGRRQSSRGPKDCCNAGTESLLDSPCRYSNGSTSATCGDFRFLIRFPGCL